MIYTCGWDGWCRTADTVYSHIESLGATLREHWTIASLGPELAQSWWNTVSFIFIITIIIVVIHHYYIIISITLTIIAIISIIIYFLSLLLLLLLLLLLSIIILYVAQECWAMLKHGIKSLHMSKARSGWSDRPAFPQTCLSYLGTVESWGHQAILKHCENIKSPATSPNLWRMLLQIPLTSANLCHFDPSCFVQLSCGVLRRPSFLFALPALSLAREILWSHLEAAVPAWCLPGMSPQRQEFI